MSLEIKTMQLYNHIDRIYNELKELNKSDTDVLNATELSAIDSLHYLGNDAIKNGIEEAHITESSIVLDIGSGFGGPARMLHTYTNCSVDAMELQQDLHEIAASLTKRCQLNKVRHLHGDFLQLPIHPNHYQAICSWLVFLHIENHNELMHRCYESLEKGGYLYVEDFYMKEPFTTQEIQQLKNDIYISKLTSMDELKKVLHEAGFKLIKMVDMTSKWRDYVDERAKSYKENLERHYRVHGEAGAEGLLHFYASIQALFQGGHLGGVVYTAQKV